VQDVIDVAGTVVEFRMANPHVHIIIDAEEGRDPGLHPRVTRRRSRSQSKALTSLLSLPDAEATPQTGTGVGECTVHVHSPRYDFNGDALAIVASYWMTLAEEQLPGVRFPTAELTS
jgi:hypothetical protein